MAKDEKQEPEASGQTFIHIKGIGCDGLERIRRKKKGNGKFQKKRRVLFYFFYFRTYEM